MLGLCIDLFPSPQRRSIHWQMISYDEFELVTSWATYPKMEGYTIIQYYSIYPFIYSAIVLMCPCIDIVYL